MPIGAPQPMLSFYSFFPDGQRAAAVKDVHTHLCGSRPVHRFEPLVAHHLVGTSRRTQPLPRIGVQQSPAWNRGRVFFYSFSKSVDGMAQRIDSLTGKIPTSTERHTSLLCMGKVIFNNLIVSAYPRVRFNLVPGGKT